MPSLPTVLTEQLADIRSRVLIEQLANIRSRVRQTLLTNGISRLAVVAVGSILAACLADWLFHFDDQGVRPILGLSILGVSGWVAYRHLLTPLSVGFSNVDLALRIEDRYPGFQDSLASSVQFLEGQADPRIGSPALQQAVVRDTLSRLTHFDCRDVLQTRGVRRAALFAAMVCLAAAVIAALDHRQSSIALWRLFLPFSAPAWPRQTSLRLLNADLEPLGEPGDELQVARGDLLKLFAENQSGSLPLKVSLEYRSTDARVLTEPMRPMTVGGGDKPSREVAVGQVPAVKGEMQFRAVGGDDDSMPWYRLRVVPPPVVENLEITLTPPPYSRRPIENQPAGVGHVQGLVGTRVDILATVSKPLASATVRVRDQQKFAVNVAGDRQTLTASFVIAEPGLYSWWFDLEDQQGFQNAEPPRYEVRGIADSEPDIRIDLPASDLQVTADAEVLVRTVAKDDLGINDIRLVFRRDDKEAAGPQVIPLKVSDDRPLEQTLEYPWTLSELSLNNGARLVFHTEATDDFELTNVLPAGQPAALHVGRSVVRTLTIVSKDEKTRELAQRQAGLLDDLERVFQLQRQARDQVGELQLQMQKADRLRLEDLDMLQRTEMGQREVAGQLVHPSSGLERRARNLLDELRDNHLDDPQSERRLAEIAGELERLGENNLPVIEAELTLARKLVQAGKTGVRESKTGGAKEDSRNKTPSTRPDGDRPSPKAPSGQGRMPDGASDEKSPEAKPDESARGGKSRAASPRGKSDKPAGSQERPNDAPSRSNDPGSPDAETNDQPSDDETPPTADETAGSPEAPSGSAGEKRPQLAKAGSAGKAAAKNDRASRARKGNQPDDALGKVAENQQEVLESLAEMLRDLSEWRTESDAARELANMIKQQAELNQKTGELGRQTVARPKESLSPQELADQARLAERQKKQADQLNELESRLKDKVDSLSQSNPSAASSIKDTLDQAREQGVAPQMRDAAGQIGENHMGEASRSQQEILEKLRELENTLNDSQNSDTETLVKKLKQAEQELQNQRDRQAELLQKLDKARQLTDPAERKSELERLAKRQQELREETARMARKLQRLQARKPSAAAQRAAARMQQAQDEMDEGDEAEAAAQEQEALDDLDQAQRELARERRRAEEQLAREQLDKIAGELAAMIGREQAIIEETRRLEELRTGTGKLNRGQVKSLIDLTGVQRSLNEDTDRLVEKLSAAEVFAHTLRGAARSMQRAVELLEQRETGAETQLAEESARRRFVDLTVALQQDKDDNANGKPPGDAGQEAGGGEGENDEGPQTDGIPAIAQLKMLLALQRELFERTTRLNELKAAGKALTPAQQHELELLAQEQGELADLTRNLSRLAAQADDDASPPETPPAKPDNEGVPEGF
ncbi:MAG: hypothetical protein EXS05_11035 [Planctomycetaceae bacterium]|nr:hypothetical protein [Planctomycetaceae bacterium]